jgi:hypothetical protein
MCDVDTPFKHVLSDDGCTVSGALTLLEATLPTLRNDTTYAVVDGSGRFEGTLSLVHLIVLLEATIENELPLTQMSLAEAEVA